MLESISDLMHVVDCLFVEWNYMDKDADYKSDEGKTAERGNYIVTTIEEIAASSST